MIVYALYIKLKYVMKVFKFFASWRMERIFPFPSLISYPSPEGILCFYICASLKDYQTTTKKNPKNLAHVDVAQ